MNHKVVLSVIIIVVLVLIGLFVVLTKKKNTATTPNSGAVEPSVGDPVLCQESQECYNNGSCVNEKCQCTGNFDPTTNCLTCKSGQDCSDKPVESNDQLTIEFFDEPNYQGSVHVVKQLAGQTGIYKINDMCQQGEQIPFKPFSVRGLPKNYQICFHGQFFNPGDTECGPSSMCFGVSGQIGKPSVTENCFEDLYRGVGTHDTEGGCAGDFIRDYPSGFITIGPLNAI
jgi:hypothetical protein